MTRQTRGLTVLLLSLLASLLTACGDDGGGSTDGAEASTINLAFFPNLTHAPALVGLEEGIFAEHVGADVEIKENVFNAGPDVVTGILAGDLDIAFIGPNPAINAYAQSNGEAIRIISGAASGGAALVVAEDIESLEDLEGKTLSSPQLGNTQDVALRHWLKEQGKEVDETGGGFLTITPQANSDSLAAFVNGDIDGAWVPEPFVTRYIQEGSGHILVDEADLWDDGAFVTTHVIVRTAFLEDNPDLVERFLEGVVASVDFINESPEDAKVAANAVIERETEKPLPDAVIDAAWENLTFTVDPIAASLAKSKDHAVEVELLDEVDIADIYDLSILNDVLAALDQQAVDAL